MASQKNKFMLSMELHYWYIVDNFTHISIRAGLRMSILTPELNLPKKAKFAKPSSTYLWPNTKK